MEKTINPINPMEHIAQDIKDKLTKNRQEIEKISIDAFLKEITTKEASAKLEILKEVQDDLYIMLGKVLEEIKGDKNKTVKTLYNTPIRLIDEKNFGDVDSFMPQIITDDEVSPKFKAFIRKKNLPKTKRRNTIHMQTKFQGE
ncbi:MAG: hypothetical protein PHX21_13150 [bacterium]|nr:hypothetical protein [bacterium]